MKRNVWRFLGIVLLALSLLFLMLSCTPSLHTSLQEGCCQECQDASQRDPSGYDIRIKPCSAYALTEECGVFFVEEPLLVKDCSMLE